MAVVRLLPGFGFVRDGGTGKVRILPGFGFVKDSAGSAPTNITLAQASWLWTGVAPSVNAKTMLALAQATWTWTGQAASVNAKRMITLAQGAWNWFGIPLQGAASTAYQNLMLFFGIEP